MHKRIFFSVLLAAVFLTQSPLVHAEDLPSTIVSVSFDTKSIALSQIVSSNDTFAHLVIPPKTLHTSTSIELKQIDVTEMQNTYPDSLSIISSVYVFDLTNKKSYDGSRDLLIDIQIPNISNTFPLRGQRSVYFFNGVHQTWEILPSVDDAAVSIVHARIRLPFARIAVFEDKTIAFGKASWYRYKGCNCTASPDYPKGTKLRVTNIDDPKKSVVVKVNDFGPIRTKLPDRIIDLDKVAFKKIAKTSNGVARVRIEVIK